MADSTFEKEFLEAHNAYRQRHGASPLTISKDLCKSAQKWAEYLLSRKNMQHSQGDYGENLYYAWSSAAKQLKGNEAVDNWYDEIKDYNFRRPGFQSKTGHFTQVVWKGSEKLGVGLATDGNTVFVVGQYLPAGNISNPGYFEKNVLPAGSSVETPQSGDNDFRRLPSRQAGSDHNSSSTTESTFEKEFLEAHNAYRQRHGASPLTISKDLCKSAQKWAEYLLSRKTMQHSQGDYGENLYYAWSSAAKQLKGKEAVDNWYNEIKDYNFRRPGFQSNTGHFTQVVWKGSEKLGVGLATDGNTVFVVGQYLPAGNISNPGYFEKNVLPAGSPVEVLNDAARSGEKEKQKLPSRQPGNDQNSSSLTSTKSTFEKEFLEAHNAYRQRHGASPLTISKDLCKSSQKWAEYLLSTKKMQHSMADYGENLYYTWSSVPKQLKGHEAVDSWYNEIKDYNYSRPGFQSKTGHFTQVVWKGSEKLGVGLATDGNTTFVVGQYLPAGNVSNPGYFEKNVLPAGSSVETSAAGSRRNDEDRSERSSSILAGAGGGKNSEFGVSAVDAMNGYRRQHGAKPLSICPALSKEAQEWANYLVKSNMVRNHGKGHGESLWYQSGSSAATPKGEDVVKSWYNENSKYNFSYPGFQKGTGNFTQMVWRSSEKVGVALATNGSGLFISVALFEPAGNINSRSHFQDNVKAKS